MCSAAVLMTLGIVALTTATPVAAADGSGDPLFATAGSVRVGVSDADVDGDASTMRVADTNGGSGSSLDLRVGDTFVLTRPGRNINVRVRLEPTVSDRDTRVTDLTEWMGRVRFDLVAH